MYTLKADRVTMVIRTSMYELIILVHCVDVHVQGTYVFLAPATVQARDAVVRLDRLVTAIAATRAVALHPVVLHALQHAPACDDVTKL